MRIQMIRGVVGEGSVDWLPGDVVEASDQFALYLITRGKARKYESPVDEPVVESRVAAQRDPKPTRRR